MDEWSARRKDLYQTEHTKPSMSPTGFEPTIPAGEALDRAATGTGRSTYVTINFNLLTPSGSCTLHQV